MYAFRTSLGPVELAFTDRHGGVSGAPYDSLNLAAEGGDDPAATAENLRRVLADFAPGAEVRDAHQVHGRTVAVVDDGPPAPRPDADALVTDRSGPVLLVRAADCVPVLLADPGRGVVAAAHAGRGGVVLGVVHETLDRMRRLGATDVTAWVGPHVCGGCYEVPAEMRAEVAARVPATFATTSWGTPALDLGAGVRAQLELEGVEVVDVARCTVEGDDLYSHRRDGAGAGRIAGLVRMVP
ncbi:peptidoglycan editing factor PgeF [Nocardioides sp. SYSU D00038]|uniref:peptidoglycan editing factor PgeF n=1 Tax=Nocardioides sp. SYSU D00038 TaxID=2812554 RepID=UPI0019681D5B|nr:peptidoglycan editing factor PgeF [Nocardioides sp. SYSU D00038]